MKRAFDIFFSLFGLLLLLPVFLVFAFLVWKQDGYSPLYIAPRVGKDCRKFAMVKLRSMIIGADKSGVDSTSNNDKRITRIGILIRRFKVDELTQLWNVLTGDMSLVGPRPNIEREVALYTAAERELLKFKPGITDFASIVFSDEGQIISGHPDPDIAYHQLIRPGKSRLGLFYVENQSLVLDIALVLVTIMAVFSKPTALRVLLPILKWLGADENLLLIAAREHALQPSPPPGSNKIVTSRV